MARRHHRLAQVVLFVLGVGGTAAQFSTSTPSPLEGDGIPIAQQIAGAVQKNCSTLGWAIKPGNRATPNTKVCGQQFSPLALQPHSACMHGRQRCLPPPWPCHMPPSSQRKHATRSTLLCGMHACMLEERLVACVSLGLDKTVGVLLAITLQFLRTQNSCFSSVNAGTNLSVMFDPPLGARSVSCGAALL